MRSVHGAAHAPAAAAGRVQTPSDRAGRLRAALLLGVHRGGAPGRAFEAAGRHLADLRLWRDGIWLDASEPEREVIEPRKGQPLLACRLATRLEPGLYLLTAYGGPGQPWAEGGEARPFHLRWGVPSLPEALRRRYEVSPFGVDRFLVPGTATFVRVELPEARAVELGVTDYSDETPFGSASAVAAIDKKTVPPVAELNPGTPRRLPSRHGAR